MLGHVAKYYRNNERCSNCGKEDHKYADCKEETKYVNCCFHNNKFKSNLETKHNSRRKGCEMHLREVNNLHQRIDYGLNNISISSSGSLTISFINLNHTKQSNLLIANDISNLGLDILVLDEPYYYNG